jgi:arylsulfatase A-like enzyme
MGHRQTAYDSRERCIPRRGLLAAGVVRCGLGLLLLLAACGEPPASRGGPVRLRFLERPGGEQGAVERVVFEASVPEQARHWGTHVERPARLPVDDSIEVRTWGGAGQLLVTQPLDPGAYNRVRLQGRFRSGSTLELALGQGDRKQTWEAAVSGREDPPGSPLRTVTFDVPRPRRGGGEAEQLTLTVHSSDCEVHSLTLSDAPVELGLPAATQPEPVGLSNEYRLAAGVTSQFGLETALTARPGDTLSFWYGVPETLPAPPAGYELRVVLQGGQDRCEATIPLQQAASRPRRWHRAALSLDGLEGEPLRVGFELVAGEGAPAACLVADAWVRPGRASAVPTRPFVDLISEAIGAAGPLQGHDQSFRGIPLDSQRSGFEGSAAVAGQATLRYSGCFTPGAGTGEAPRSLRVALTHEGGQAAEGRVALEGDSPWWSSAVELPSSWVGEVRVQVEAELLEGDSVLLQELVVENALPQRDPAPAPPRILLISLDTLREDLGGSVRTPHLDALAAESQVWSPHYAGASWTKPSHATLLSGYRGETHGCVTHFAPIAPGVPMLAERFQREGIRTAALVYGVEWLDPRWGFARGFDEYRVVHERISRQVRHVANWMEEYREEPFLFFFHSFEPHSDTFRLPYESPGTTQAEIDERFGTQGYGCSGELCATLRLDAINSGRAEPLPGEAEILRELYARGVEETDRALGELFDQLRRSGLWDDLLVVVTSDHGEALLEHGRVMHGAKWEPIVRVPLLVKWPGAEWAGTRGSFASGSIDVVPTLLRHAGLPLESLPGSPLQDLDRERPILVAGSDQALIWDGWKVIGNRGFTELTGLFHLAADPDEDTDLLDAGVPELARLLEIAQDLNRADLLLRERYQQATDSDQLPTLSEEELQQLRALGY